MTREAINELKKYTLGRKNTEKIEVSVLNLNRIIFALEEPEPVLDKIRTEIEEKYGNCNICEWFEDYDYEENDVSEYRSVGNVSDILAIINKYKAESEPQESEDKG